VKRAICISSCLSLGTIVTIALNQFGCRGKKQTNFKSAGCSGNGFKYIVFKIKSTVNENVWSAAAFLAYSVTGLK